MATTEPFIIAADALLPMDPALPKVLQNAGVVIQSPAILGIGELADLRRKFGILAVQHHPGTLLPGFINAHTHLELSHQSAIQLRAPHFTQWVSNLIASYPPPDQLESQVRTALRRGIADSLSFGVTTLGDISRHVQITRDEFTILATTSVPSVPRVVSFGEVVGLGKMRDRAPAMIAAAAAGIRPASDTAPRLLTGISPHAPYTVEGPTLRACLRQAIIKRLPITMHLAELAEETDFLRDLSGPLGRDWDLMRKMDILDDQIPRMKGGPVRWAQLWGLLLADAREQQFRDFPVLLAHVNYCDYAELAQLAASRTAVAFCPRTHAYFGHPPHRFADMLASGINVCLATDSLASNPDLSVLREAQFLWNQRDRHPLDAYTLLEMITRRPAAALGLADHVGTLTAGKQADLALLPINDASDPVTNLIAEAPAPTALWIGGKQVDLTPASQADPH